MSRNRTERRDNRELGPRYDIDGPALTKWRRAASNLPMAEWSRWERRKYGDAVEKAVLAKQRALLFRDATPDYRSPCASGTWHSDGAEIHKAVLAQQRNALLAAPAAIRRARTPNQWAEMYETAMREKSGRS